MRFCTHLTYVRLFALVFALSSSTSAFPSSEEKPDIDTGYSLLVDINERFVSEDAQKNAGVVAWGQSEVAQYAMPEPNVDLGAVSSGTLTVSIEPEEAVAAGARWRVVGIASDWHESGTSISLPVDEYAIEFYDDISGWYAPTSQTLMIVADQAAQTSATYSPGLTWKLSLDTPHGYAIQSVPETIYGPLLKKNHHDGTTLTLSAQPRQGYHFSRWTGDVPAGSETNNSFILTMDADKSVSAEFVQQQGRIEGGIVAWEENYTGQCTVPNPNTAFMSISAGVYSLGLKSNGSVMAWGWNGDGQCNVPEPNTDFIALLAGYDDSMGLKANGSIVRWGKINNTYVQPEPNSDFVAITRFRGLKADGSIVLLTSQNLSTATEQNSGFVAITSSHGLKSDGSIVPFNNENSLAVPEPNSDFVAISAGTGFYLGLKSYGSVVAWGDNYYGQCSVPEPNNGFVAISAGYKHSLGLKTDGSVVAWGAIQYTGTKTRPATVPEDNTNFTAISAGWNHSMALKALGTVEVVLEPQEAVEAGAKWRVSGINDEWRDSGTSISLFDGDHTIEFLDTLPGWYGPSTQSVTVALDEPVQTSATYTTGLTWTLSLETQHGYIMQTFSEANYSPLPKEYFRDGSTVTLSAQPNQGYFFSHWTGDVPEGAETSMSLVLTMDANKVLVAEFVQQDLGIVSWGGHSTDYYSVPEPNSGFVAISAASYHSLGLKSDGSIVAWGDNTYDQCTVPEPNTDFVAVAAGREHSLGLKSDGSIVAWGRSDHYFGKTENNQCEVPEPNTNFVAIAAGKYLSLGLKTDGSIVAWGVEEWYWDRGDYRPCQAPYPNKDFVAISAGGDHCLALRSDGSIVSWGPIIPYDQPPHPSTVPEVNTGFIAVSAGSFHSMGLKSDGSIVAWEGNQYGQCTVPEPNTDFIAMSAGFGHSLGLKSNRSVVTWRYSYDDELSALEPNTDFFAVSAGLSRNLGLKPSGSLSADIFPQEAVEAGARWRIAGIDDEWRESGTTVSLLGDYTIEFFDNVTGWFAPSTQTVTVVSGETTQTSATYTAGLTWTLNVYAQGGSVAKSPNKINHRDGTTVTLVAEPDAGYHFTGWSGDSNSMASTLVVTMDSTKTLTANFEINTYVLNASGNHGDVSVDPDQALYEHGTTVSCAAVPDAGYNFTGWTGDIPPNKEMDNPIVVIMDAHKSVTATFTVKEGKPARWLLH